MTRATSTNFNKILGSVALIFIFKKYFGSWAEKGWAPRLYVKAISLTKKSEFTSSLTRDESDVKREKSRQKHKSFLGIRHR